MRLPLVWACGVALALSACSSSGADHGSLRICNDVASHVSFGRRLDTGWFRTNARSLAVEATTATAKVKAAALAAHDIDLNNAAAVAVAGENLVSACEDAGYSMG